MRTYKIMAERSERSGLPVLESAHGVSGEELVSSIARFLREEVPFRGLEAFVGAIAVYATNCEEAMEVVRDMACYPSPPVPTEQEMKDGFVFQMTDHYPSSFKRGVRLHAPSISSLLERGADPIDLSIMKWVVIVEYLRKHPDIYISDGSGTTCALCQAFPTCSRCPIGKFYEVGGCEISPYALWRITRSLQAALSELAFLRAIKEIEDNKSVKS